MASITTRVGKGSPLTTQELDANFTNLNNDKQEASTAVTLTGTQTLTNKTLTSPVISGGTANGLTISNTPAGNISATTVQAAINELDAAISGTTSDTVAQGNHLNALIQVTGAFGFQFSLFHANSGYHTLMAH